MEILWLGESSFRSVCVQLALVLQPKKKHKFKIKIHSFTKEIVTVLL